MANSTISIPWSASSGEQNFNATTNLSYTGISIEVPREKPFILSVRAAFIATEPQEVWIGTSNSQINYYTRRGGGNCGIALYSDYINIGKVNTFYIWARYDIAGTNMITWNLTTFN